MTRILLPAKPLTVNPLKVSQPMGATLAFLGLNRCLPLEHGAQGCTAFSKVFFTRHFREPIPIQTTAMNQVVTVMGADDNVVEALFNIAEAHHPDVVGLITTGLTETQGADIGRTLKEFRTRHPQHGAMAVVPVNAPDTVGSLESGYARAVEAIIRHLVPESRSAGKRARQVNVLLSSMLTPGDVESIREWVEAFGLSPILLPDLGDSLDGHLESTGYSDLTTGGTGVGQLEQVGKSIATLVVGPSLFPAADLLKARTGVPDFRFRGLLALEDCDLFIQILADISGREIPPYIARQRAQLLDAMVDCHFPLGTARVAIAADPDLLGVLSTFVIGMGGEVVSAVASARADSLALLPLDQVTVGDLEDIEDEARAGAVQVLLANSHGQMTADRLGASLLRCGFPLYDSYGAYARQWVGYRGSRQLLFDLANLCAASRREITPYRSLYWQGGPRDQESSLMGVQAQAKRSMSDDTGSVCLQ